MSVSHCSVCGHSFDPHKNDFARTFRTTKNRYPKWHDFSTSEAVSIYQTCSMRCSNILDGVGQPCRAPQPKPTEKHVIVVRGIDNV